MSVAAFSNIETDFRIFLHSVCLKVTGGDPEYLRHFNSGKFKSYDELEIGDYCRFLIHDREIVGHNTSLLLRSIEVSRNFCDDLSFVSKLRNKYFHMRGTTHVDSQEQLADLLIIRRIVRILASVSGVATENLEIRLQSTIHELIEQVAAVEMPERYDFEAEVSVLNENDREFLRGTFADEITKALISYAPSPGGQTDVHVSGVSTLGQSILEQLITVEKKLKPLTALKGRLDSLESTLSSSVTRINESLCGMDDTLDGILGALEIDSGEPEQEDDSSAIDVLEQIRIQSELISRRFSNFLEPKITKAQARDELITLRKRIWKETGEGASADGLLRKSMIDLFLDYLPTTEEDAHNSMGPYLKWVTETQIPYLPDVCRILNKVET